MQSGIVACLAGQTAAIGGAGVGHTYGAEMWPAAAGLTFLHASSPAQGDVDYDGSGVPGRAVVSSPPTFVSGDKYQVSYDLMNPNSDFCYVFIGGTTCQISSGHYSSTITIGFDDTGQNVVPVVQALSARDDDNAGSAAFTNISIKKQLT